MNLVDSEMVQDVLIKISEDASTHLFPLEGANLNP
jgi:hypothetical protein